MKDVLKVVYNDDSISFWNLSINESKLRCYDSDLTIENVDTQSLESIRYCINNSEAIKYDNLILKQAVDIIDISNSAKYYPRIFRPCQKKPHSFYNSLQQFDLSLLGNEKPINKEHLVKSLLQLSILVERLSSIFKTVYPHETNLECYGFEIRNLLILSCTELESQFRGILNSNGYKIKKGGDLGSKDYVKLNSVLKLREYSIGLADYPSIESQPFKGWDSHAPTKSLEWQSGYNSVKHDNLINFKSGTLKSAIEATSACFIILVAQFGLEVVLNSLESKTFFNVKLLPSWSKEEFYFTSLFNKAWVRKNVEF